MVTPYVFRVFSSRNYSYFFFGQIISRMGTWMQRTAVIWVIYTITHSLLMVGIATFAEQFPSFFLSPAGGITADKYERNKIVIVTQIVSAIQAVLLTVLYYLGWHSIWLILFLSLILGVANAFDIPARQAMVNDLVANPDFLPGAIAMNSSLNNFTRLAGPALAGVVMAAYGATACFAANAISFIAVIYCLFKLKIPKHGETMTRNKNSWKNFNDGLKYTLNNKEIGRTLLLAALVSFLVITYNTLQPYFAHDVFFGNAATFGYINGSTGLGALISTLVIASQKNGNKLKGMLFFNLILLGIGLIVMSYVHILYLYLIMSLICGFGAMSTMPICNTIVQTVSSPEMRGRVVGFFAMATMGMIPLGSLVMGWLAKIIGPQNCQFAQGIVCLLIVGAFFRFFKREKQSTIL